jgi:uncharacterized protein
MRREDLRFLPPRNSARPRVSQQPSSAPEVVDPRWILKALGAVLACGLLCAYVTLCLFFYMGQWEFVLHPSRSVQQTPAAQHLAFEPVRFGADQGGQPQLSGWWLPADLPSDPTVLFLHGGTGSMSDSLAVAKALHDARLNVLLFDYRGFGQSAGKHPSQHMMEADTEDAFRFLTDTRHIPVSEILPFGQGLGASLATTLCARNPQLRGLVLFDADGDTATRVEADQRSHIVPIGMLFHERFPLADPLHALSTPKLILSSTRGSAPEVAVRAANPKMTVELGPGVAPQQLGPPVRRFLDTYFSSPPPPLNPAH